MTSPRFQPASARPSVHVGDRARRQDGSSPMESAISSTPSAATRARPGRRTCFAAALGRRGHDLDHVDRDGEADADRAAGQKIARLMPISPRLSYRSAPRQVPGLMAASVWMKNPWSVMPICVPPARIRYPASSVCPYAEGPMADTGRRPQRIRIADLDRRRRACPSGLAQPRRSVRGSRNTMSAGNSRRSCSATFTLRHVLDDVVCW